jgi:adenylate cyclase class IV
VGERENIELKAADPDPAATERACRALGAVESGLLVQRDTYLGVAHGRLKLREDLQRATGELIFYLRAHDKGLRSSSYWRAPATDPRALLGLLAAAHGVIGVVTKRRRLFLHRNVRIHLDDVEGLGSFIELESVLALAGKESAEEAEALAEVVKALGLARSETIAAGYLELLDARSGSDRDRASSGS